jgi:hypothetical protein
VRELLGYDESVVANESAAGCSNSFLPVLRKRNVRRASVAAVEGPFGFAVADYEAAGCCHGGREQAVTMPQEL